MAKVHKIVHLQGESPDGWDAAANNAVEEASKTLRGIKRVEAKKFDIKVKDGKIAAYRVLVEVVFELER